MKDFIGVSYGFDSRLPTMEEVKRMREIYKSGVRVELLEMDDPQAPPRGTRGTVLGVDDIGSVMVRWDNGSGLSSVYDKDKFRVIDDG